MVDLEAQKRAAAEAAVAEVRPGMLVGIGTGSTAAFLIDALGARVRDGLSITTVATSLATEAHARSVGLAPIDMGDVGELDLAIDGVDEIDPAFRVIKGGGGALLREKIVGAAARRMIAIADSSKRVDVLKRPLPIEVLPFARASVERHLRDLGGTPAVRKQHSDQGNLLIDCDFGSLADPAHLAIELSQIPGLLGHGLFLSEIDALYVGTQGGVDCLERAASFPGD